MREKLNEQGGLDDGILGAHDLNPHLQDGEPVLPVVSVSEENAPAADSGPENTTGPHELTKLALEDFDTGISKHRKDDEHHILNALRDGKTLKSFFDEEGIKDTDTKTKTMRLREKWEKIVDGLVKRKLLSKDRDVYKTVLVAGGGSDASLGDMSHQPEKAEKINFRSLSFKELAHNIFSRFSKFESSNPDRYEGYKNIFDFLKEDGQTDAKREAINDLFQDGDITSLEKDALLSALDDEEKGVDSGIGSIHPEVEGDNKETVVEVPQVVPEMSAAHEAVDRESLTYLGALEEVFLPHINDKSLDPKLRTAWRGSYVELKNATSVENVKTVLNQLKGILLNNVDYELILWGLDNDEKKKKQENPPAPPSFWNKSVAEDAVKTPEQNEAGVEIVSGSFSLPSEWHPERNEDQKYEDTGRMLFGVFDGMGGAEGGDRASVLAVQVISSSPIVGSSVEDVKAEMLNIFQRTNTVVYNDSFQAGKNPEDRMATTATLAKIVTEENGNMFLVTANVGDSRAYVWSFDAGLDQVTIDANRAHFEMKRDGKNEDEIRAFQKKCNNASDMHAFDNPNKLQESIDRARFAVRNQIASNFGSLENTYVDTFVTRVEQGSVVLITSDGIHDNLTDNEISEYIREGLDKGLTAEELSQLLVFKAQERSKEKDPSDPTREHFRAKPDDMTAVVIFVGVKQKIENPLSSDPEKPQSYNSFYLFDQYPELVDAFEKRLQLLERNGYTEKKEAIENLRNRLRLQPDFEGMWLVLSNMVAKEEISESTSKFFIDILREIDPHFNEHSGVSSESIHKPTTESPDGIFPSPPSVVTETLADSGDAAPSEANEVLSVSPESLEQLKQNLDLARAEFAKKEFEHREGLKKGVRGTLSGWLGSLEDVVGMKHERPESTDEEYKKAKEEYLAAKYKYSRLIAEERQKEVDALPEVVTDKKVLVSEILRTEALEDFHALNQKLKELEASRETTFDKIPGAPYLKDYWNKYRNLSPKTRMVLSATLLTAGSYALGNVGIDGAMAMVGVRLARSVLGAGVGIAAGKVYDKYLAKGEDLEKKDASEKAYTVDSLENLGAFGDAEKNLAEYFAEQERILKRNKIKKAALMIGATGITTYGAGRVGQGIGGFFDHSKPIDTHDMSSQSQSGSTNTSMGRPNVPSPETPPVKPSPTGRVPEAPSSLNEVKPPVLDPATGRVIPAVNPDVSVDRIVRSAEFAEPISVELSDKGFIKTIDLLKDQMAGKKMSPEMDQLLQQTPEKIAMDLGLYKPDAIGVSAFGLKGEHLLVDDKGNIVLEHLDGHRDTLFEGGTGKIKTFDSFDGNKMLDKDGEVFSDKMVGSEAVEEGTASVYTQPPLETEQIRSVSDIENGNPSLGVENSPQFDPEKLLKKRLGDFTDLERKMLPTIDRTQFVRGHLVWDKAELAVPKQGFKSLINMLDGKLPLKPEYQFSLVFAEMRRAYGIKYLSILNELSETEKKSFVNLDFNGGLVTLHGEGDGVTMFLNGEKIGAGVSNGTDVVFTYEQSLGSGFIGKNGYEKAFEFAKSELLKKIKEEEITL